MTTLFDLTRSVAAGLGLKLSVFHLGANAGRRFWNGAVLGTSCDPHPLRNLSVALWGGPSASVREVIDSPSMDESKSLPGRRRGLLAPAILLAALVPAAAPLSAQTAGSVPGKPALEIPEDLTPEGPNLPVLPEGLLDRDPDHYDEEGFPEDERGLLLLEPRGDGYLVRLQEVADPFLLYAQFANRQRDAVFLARDGLIRDPLPDGSVQEIPYGFGALKTNAVYISLVEGLLLPHVSDNRKSYDLFPLRDLYLGGSLGITGLLAELRYVHRERIFGYAQGGLNLLGGAAGTFLAPLNFYALALRFGGGVQFPGLLENLIGDNHWSVGADLLLGFGDADQNPDTPAVVWIPGVFFELEKRNLFGWGSRWAGFGEPGDFRQDPRPLNYHLRALYARLGFYLDLQNGSDSGYAKFDLSFGFRYNLLGPRIPEHLFKDTRVLYLSEVYRDQLLEQRRSRESRLRSQAEAAGVQP